MLRDCGDVVVAPSELLVGLPEADPGLQAGRVRGLLLVAPVHLRGVAALAMGLVEQLAARLRAGCGREGVAGDQDESRPMRYP